ncbi:hypothetical protein TNCV_710401 [Trichonephila clavipes]|uniref:Uncharacterized protein n=1 Tax=Trichonephila clavipes TaxID=2585209 RepID=A0A8X6RLC2_TRICX|nr:hypothetical protein TNCV_710401 [Trichonephila clavipes]
MSKLGKTKPLPGYSSIASIRVKYNFILMCLHPPRSPTREAVCRSFGKNQARRFPGLHPEYSDTASGRLTGAGSILPPVYSEAWAKGLWFGREKKKWDDKKRVENREGSLGYAGFVTRVFTNDSKPLGKRKRSLENLGIVTPVLILGSVWLQWVRSHLKSIDKTIDKLEKKEKVVEKVVLSTIHTFQDHQNKLVHHQL